MLRVYVLGMALLGPVGANAQTTVVGGIDNPPNYTPNTTCYPESGFDYRPDSKVLAFTCDDGRAFECRMRTATYDPGTRTLNYTCEAAPVVNPDLEVRVFPAFAQVNPGATPFLDIIVRNIGTATITEAAATAAGVPGCAVQWGTLTPGQQVSRRCTLIPVNADQLVGVAVSAVKGGSLMELSAQALYWLRGPRARLRVTPTWQLVQEGARPQISSTVQNIGTTPLVALDLATDRPGPCATTRPSLPQGQLFSHPCTLPPALASYDDAVVLAAESDVGAPMLAQADFHVEVEPSQDGSRIFKDGFE